MYAMLLPTTTGIDGTELADDHDGGSTVEWATWNDVVVRVEGQPLASEQFRPSFLFSKLLYNQLIQYTGFYPFKLLSESFVFLCA